LSLHPAIVQLASPLSLTPPALLAPTIQ
jgi:hypothetical protein